MREFSQEETGIRFGKSTGMGMGIGTREWEEMGMKNPFTHTSNTQHRHVFYGPHTKTNGRRTPIISAISLGSIVPSPLTSYIWKAHSSFCSGFPVEVMLIANRNSLKSMRPLLSASNVRNTCSQNFSALPCGKKLE